MAGWKNSSEDCQKNNYLCWGLKKKTWCGIGVNYDYHKRYTEKSNVSNKIIPAISHPLFVASRKK